MDCERTKLEFHSPRLLREISIVSEACTQVQYVHHEPVLPQVPSPRGPWLAWKLWQHTPLKRTKCPWAVGSTECPKEKTVVGETRSPMASKSTGMVALDVVSSHWHTAYGHEKECFFASSPVRGWCCSVCHLRGRINWSTLSLSALSNVCCRCRTRAQAWRPSAAGLSGNV